VLLPLISLAGALFVGLLNMHIWRIFTFQRPCFVLDFQIIVHEIALMAKELQEMLQLLGTKYSDPPGICPWTPLGADSHHFLDAWP